MANQDENVQEADKLPVETPPEGQPVKTTEEVDYKTKFSESSREAQRLLEEKKQLEETIELLLSNNAPVSKEEPKAEQPSQDIVAPLKAEVDAMRQNQVQEAVESFITKHPDAAQGSETFKQVIEWLPAMRAKGLPLSKGLEKAYEIVTVDKAKQSGKREALDAIFAKTQAAAGSVSSVSAKSGSAPELTAEEKKVADALGIPHEKYASNKPPLT